MVATNRKRFEQHEEKIAELTEAAYRAVIEQGYDGPFLELELSLWDTIREAVERESRNEIGPA